MFARLVLFAALEGVLVLASTPVDSYRPVPAPAAVCTQLKAISQVGNATVVWPSDPSYVDLATENWSQTTWAKPSCIFRPTQAQHVQKAVVILKTHKVQFAVRSGGHSPSPGAANINNGVLIDMSLLNSVSYDEKKQLATIGTGQKWENVYAQLDKSNVTVVGGRVLDVGVGGLLLGGGLSYLSNLYGMVCDNVVNYEVVLSSGRLVNANSNSNPDLFWALKGGANNFGIVTSATLKTYPIHNVWGGSKFYPLTAFPALMDAFAAFQAQPADPYANLMMQVAVTNDTVGAILNLIYLKPEENPKAYAPFYNIGVAPLVDTTKLSTLTEFLSGQVQPPIPRWDWHATSSKPNADLYQTIANITSSGPEIAKIKSLNAGTLVLGMQPILPSLVTAGRAQGGPNALGLSAEVQTWFVLDMGWWLASDDAAAHSATKAVTSQIVDAAKQSGDHLPYIFMNDASWDQDVFGGYGSANLERLRRVRRFYDPEGVFQRLSPGGFKVQG